MFEAFAKFAVSFFPVSGKSAELIEYWLYNNAKILFILVLVVFAVSYLRTYFPPEKIREYLQGKNLLFGYSFAVILGVISPFCTCSTIPLFLGLVSAGVPFGIVTTFLFVSPMINFAAIIVLFGTMGIEVTLSYVIGGIAIAILGSIVLVKLKMDRFLIRFDIGEMSAKEQSIDQRERVKAACRDGVEIIRQIFPYVLLGVTVGAGIHGFVPERIITDYLSGMFSVPGAVLVGVPVYTDILGVIPVAESLINKGLPIGTAVAFMMSVAALSFPQFILLKKAMKSRLLFYYAATLSLGIIILGLFLNLFF